MKKVFLIIFLLCMFPISVLAKQESKENLLKTIGEIQNVQVDDDIIIENTKVEEDTITLHLLKGEKKVQSIIHYTFIGYCFIFESGYVDLTNNKIIENESAFYLYSILESLSTAPYDEENYYNNNLIQKKMMSINDNPHQTYQNIGKTFGLELKKEDNKVRIIYQYYLDGEDTILVNPIVEAGNNQILTNPNTGNLNFFVTVLLLLVVGLAGYTYCYPDKDEKNKKEA